MIVPGTRTVSLLTVMNPNNANSLRVLLKLFGVVFNLQSSLSILPFELHVEVDERVVMN